MLNGSSFLKPACIKTLVAVEARPERSHQHEFNGVVELQRVFGLKRAKYQAFFSIAGKGEKHQAGVTWYDSREMHPTRSEHRLYFQRNPVMDLAQEGDNILIGFDDQNQLHCILYRQNSSDDIGHFVGWTAV